MAFPQRISAKSGEVWHWMDCSRRRDCTRNSSTGAMRRSSRWGHRSRSFRRVAAKMCVRFSTTAIAMQHSAHLLVA